MEVLHQAPTTSAFTPLSTHQSQTPESFFSGPPILYHHSPSATLKIHANDLATAPALAGLVSGAQSHTNGTSGAVNGHAEGEDYDEEMEIKGVDVWVTSERFMLYSTSKSTGVSIPYPTISLHALQSEPPSLFLQLLNSAQTFDDHDPDATISLTIIPSAASAPINDTSIEAENSANPAQPEQQSTTQLLYAAISSCANLHPDPLSGSDNEEDPDSHPHDHNPAILFENSGDPTTDISGIYPLTNGDATAGEGGRTTLPPPMPGSGGWITAENVGEFFDEEGNWRGGEEWTDSEVLGVPGGLGAGAGVVRGREEEEMEGDGDGDGVLDGDETKWRRTE